ncbi:MAG: Ig-like domain-containing protein [Meiothermus sp.]|nr:Ig-like domain-containing protein [Meiothermus sp.]
MNPHEPIGYLASLLVLATFCMRDMSTLRLVAIASNLTFISYAVLADIDPVLLLHTLLLPINLYRLMQTLPQQNQPANPKEEDLTQARNLTQPASGRPAGWQVMEVSMNKRFSLIPALMVLALMVGCTPSAPTIASVTVSPNPATVLVSRTQTLTAVAKDASGNVVNASFTWSSGDTAIATVNATGVASGIAAGSTTITATVGGVSGSATLNVTQADPPPPPPPPSGDTTPPTIVSISPNNGSTGVAKDVKIVIDFSEAMNHQATELAYQSANLPTVTFAWSNGDTRLEIDPVSDLEYTSTGKVYSFMLDSSATDLAGNKLASVTSSFTTFRELTRTLTGVAALDGSMTSAGFKSQNPAAGDGPESLHVRGFLSFDLGNLETDGLGASSRITSVSLRAFQQEMRGAPYQDLSANGRFLMLAHVHYGPSLEAADFNTTILRNLGDLSSDGLVEYKATPNALEAVRDDWTNRTIRGNRSQFMLYFPRTSDGGPDFDYVVFAGGESSSNPPQLEVKFLVP